MRKNIATLNYLKKSGGFTLLEIIMVAGIISIVVVIGSSVVASNFRLYNQMTGSHEAFQNSRLAMSVIADTLKNFTRLDLVQGSPAYVNGYASSNQGDTSFIKVLTNGPDSSYHINYNGNLMIENDLFATDVNQPVITDGGRTIHIEVTPAGDDQTAVYTEVRKYHYPGSIGLISKL